MLYGIIDMGSNSVRLSIFREENGVITQVIGKKVMAGLAGYVKKGRLTRRGSSGPALPWKPCGRSLKTSM